MEGDVQDTVQGNVSAGEADNEDKNVGAGDPSCWYGYDIWYAPGRAPEQDRLFDVVIFRKHGPWIGSEEIGGQEWRVSTDYQAWFPTLEEASAAAEAFCDEMHWKREAEWMGVGKHLAEQLTDEVNKVAKELRDMSKQGELSEQSFEALRKRYEE